MQTHSSTELAQSIPWWHDVTPEVRAELMLSDIKEVPAQTIDVVVIGGGVAGLSAALSASRAGAGVLLLEREEVLGYGATGQNAGILSAGINMHLTDLKPDGVEAAFWPTTTQLLLSLVEEAAQPGAVLKAQLTGALSLAESRHAAQKLAREARARIAAGLRAEMWTAEQVAEATAGRLETRTVIEALWLPDEGRLQPLTLLAHLARQARVAGVVLAGQALVGAYRVIRGCATNHHWQLVLANGSIIGTRGLIRAVGPTVEANARIYALAFGAHLPESFPLFWDAAPFTYADFRPGNGRLTVSGGRYGKAGVTRHDASYHKRLADAARHWLPELAEQEPLYRWAVDLAVTADMVPTLRDISDMAPGFAIEGLGSLGVLPGIVLGQRAGKEIVARL